MVDDIFASEFPAKEEIMARPEKIGASRSAVTYRGLRDWLDRVDKLGELLKVNGADWDREMGSITQMLTESARGKAPAI